MINVPVKQDYIENIMIIILNHFKNRRLIVLSKNI